MQPTTRLSLSALLLAAFLSLLVKSALAGSVIVLPRDSRITYVGEWTDQDNGGHKFAGKGASASLTFRGNSVQWLSASNFNGASVLVNVDGEETTVDQAANTESGSPPVPATLFKKVGLDAGKQHTIQISFGGLGSHGRGYMELYGFLYTSDAEPDSSSVQTTPVASSASGGQTVTVTVGPVQTSTSHTDDDKSKRSSSIGGIVGGVIGGIACVAVIVLLFFCMRRGRRQQKIDDQEHIQKLFIESVDSSVRRKSSFLFEPDTLPRAPDLDASNRAAQPSLQTRDLPTTSLSNGSSELIISPVSQQASTHLDDFSILQRPEAPAPMLNVLSQTIVNTTASSVSGSNTLVQPMSSPLDGSLSESQTASAPVAQPTTAWSAAAGLDLPPLYTERPVS